MSAHGNRTRPGMIPNANMFTPSFNTGMGIKPNTFGTYNMSGPWPGTSVGQPAPDVRNDHVISGTGGINDPNRQSEYKSVWLLC